MTYKNLSFFVPHVRLKKIKIGDHLWNQRSFKRSDVPINCLFSNEQMRLWKNLVKILNFSKLGARAIDYFLDANRVQKISKYLKTISLNKDPLVFKVVWTFFI